MAIVSPIVCLTHNSKWCQFECILMLIQAHILNCNNQQRMYSTSTSRVWRKSTTRVAYYVEIKVHSVHTWPLCVLLCVHTTKLHHSQLHYTLCFKIGRIHGCIVNSLAVWQINQVLAYELWHKQTCLRQSLCAALTDYSLLQLLTSCGAFNGTFSEFQYGLML